MIPFARGKIWKNKYFSFIRTNKKYPIYNNILNHKRVNVTKSVIEESLITKELISFVNENEWILIKILSDLGFDYRNRH
jgi:hypothetical protein